MADTGSMRERVSTPIGETFADVILKPRFHVQLELQFPHLLNVHRAWMVMLAKCGIVASKDAYRICEALDTLEREAPDALLPYHPAREELYLHVEHYLTERLGEDIAGNLSLARTRPEPIPRMVIREKLLTVLERLSELQDALLAKAEAFVDVVMPGYTHLQQAQPTTVAHYLLAVHDVLQRDMIRLFAAYATVNRNTLGCGALSGTGLPIDRELVTRLLGFDGIVENTYDCVSAGDHLAESVCAIGVMHTTLSRFAFDLDIWHTSEFALIELSDEYAAVSSLMPQKKNPVALEYIRSRSAKVIGDVMASLTAAHNTPFEDISDLVADGGSIAWNSLDTSAQTIKLLTGIVSGLTVNKQIMLDRAREGFSTATDLAEVIHYRTGVSYRTAHRVVSRLVLHCVNNGKRAADVDAELIACVAEQVIGRRLELTDDWIQSGLDPVRFVETHNVTGGPAPDRVREMLADRRSEHDRSRREIALRRQKISDSLRSLRSMVRNLEADSEE